MQPPPVECSIGWTQMADSKDSFERWRKQVAAANSYLDQPMLFRPIAGHQTSFDEDGSISGSNIDE